MTDSNRVENYRKLDEQAASWLLTLQSDQLSEAQRAEFVDWLRESPLHISRMLRICVLERQLANFRGWQEISRSATAGSADVPRLYGTRPTLRDNAPKFRKRWAGALAAGITLLCVTGFLIVGRWGEPEFMTQSGERREITLEDGSVVDLAPKSDVVVRYRKRERLIVLKDGEALFRVAKNPDRPFIVAAATAQVRAVGTVFNVESGERGISVTVVEGRVAVSQHSQQLSVKPGVESISPILSLGANQQISITPNGTISAVRNIAGDVVRGWASDELVFDGETIAEVVRRFNQHNQTKIEIYDARLAARRVSGVFHASDYQSFITFIEAAGDVRVSRPDPDHIVVGTNDNHPH